MNLLGKWKVEKVFTDFDLDLKPQYTTKEEALKLEMYQDAESIKFINSIYDLKENGIEVIVDDEPLGNIFRSYTAAYLELVRWAADIAYSKNYYYSLIEG